MYDVIVIGAGPTGCTAGAVLKDGTAALSCEEQEDTVTVTLKGSAVYTEQARFVIASEGVIGTIKRKLRSRKEEYITTYQTFNVGTIQLDPHYFYAYLQPYLSEYDAWFNVKDHLLVLGVSTKNPKTTEHYYSNFISYMETHHLLHIDRQINAERWLMPQIKPGCPIDYGCGRVLFAGENAGFLNPMGEGISSAMESGYCLAQAIVNYGDDIASVYDAYQANTAALKTYMERQWGLVAGMAAPFNHLK